MKCITAARFLDVTQPMHGPKSGIRRLSQGIDHLVVRCGNTEPIVLGAAICATSPSRSPIYSSDTLRGRDSSQSRAKPTTRQALSQFARGQSAPLILVRKLKTANGTNLLVSARQHLLRYAASTSRFRMLVPTWLQANPYRVLRLSANATLNDAHRAATAMRRSLVLGLAITNESDIAWLGDVPRSEFSIRAAIGRLENPECRIFDRLFWFHDYPYCGGDTRASAPGALRKHDEALRLLFAAVRTEPANINVALWVKALRSWHHSLEAEDYWQLSTSLEQSGGFEPTPSHEEFTALRRKSCLLAAEPLLIAGRQSLSEGQAGQVSQVLAALAELSDTGVWTAQSKEDILAPAVSRLLDSCKSNRQDHGTKIVRESNAADSNSMACDDCLSHYRRHVESALVFLREVVPPGTEEEKSAREAASLCLCRIGDDFTWADKYTAAEELYKEALAVGEGTVATIQIQRRFEENSTLAAGQRILENLQPDAIKGLQDLKHHCDAILSEFRSQIIREQNSQQHNLALCESMLSRFRQIVQPAFQDAMARLPQGHAARSEAREIAALCLNAIATDFTWADEFNIAIRLREEALIIGEGTSVTDRIKRGISELAASARQERLSRELTPIQSAPPLRTFNGVGAKLYGQSDVDQETRSFVATYYLTVLYIPLLPLRRYRVIKDGRTWCFLGRVRFRKRDRWHLKVALTAIVLLVAYAIITSNQNAPDAQFASAPVSTGTASNNTGDSAVANIPDNSGNAAKIAEIKSEIDDGRERMATLEKSLRPAIDELRSLKLQIATDDSSIKELDDQKQSGAFVDTVEYNSKVSEYNSLVARSRTLYAAHSDDLATYEALIKHDGVLVDQYNALLR